MCICFCFPDDDIDENSDKRRWWVRIGVTLLILGITAGLVFTSVLYRTNKSKNRPKLRGFDDDQFENLANRMQEDIMKESSGTVNNTSGVTALAEYPFCAETGRKILDEGGSAVDAGIAMLLCQGVAEPHHSGLGGGFLMLIYIRKTRKVITLDARATAPSFATPSMFERFTGIQDDHFNNKERQGWLTAAVPGEALGLWEAYKKFGILPWQRLVDPAIRLASHGFRISKNLATHLAIYNDTIQNEPSLKKVFFNSNTNTTYNEGDDAVNEDFANVLMRIASEGVDYLYKGDAADAAAEESLRGAGIFTVKDFLEYKVKWSYSLSHNFKDSKNNGYTLHMPPPPSAAIMVGMILNIVQRNEQSLIGENRYSETHLAKFYHKMVEAMKHTYARKPLFGDSSTTPMSELHKYLSQHWGLTIRRLISSTNTFPPAFYLYRAPASKVNDFGTTNVAAIAGNGDVMVASSTLNDPFGAAILPKSLGFLLNNNMLTFTMTKDRMPLNKDFGNLVSANRRPFTSLCPIIVLDNDENFKLLMAAGGSVKIPTTTALILMRYFWLDIDIKKTIEMHRFHHQLIPNIVLYESDDNDKKYDMEYLRTYGHELEINNHKWPHVHIIVQENGTKISVADNRESF